MPEAHPTGLLVCDDFFFTSKVTGTAQELGGTVLEAGSQADAVLQLSEGRFPLVMIDLGMTGLDVPELLAALPAENRPTVIAFDSHVNTERMKAAREAGCDEVLPRSRFSGDLAGILGRFV